MRGRQKLTALGTAVSALAFTALAQAGTANYGTISAGGIEYTNVNESDTTVPGPGPSYLFGTPSASGENLVFNATQFAVTATGDTSPDDFMFEDGKLGTGIVVTNPPPGITSLALGEGGAFDLLGGGTNETSVTAALIVNDLFITAVNGMNLPTPIAVSPTYNSDASPLAGTIDFTDSGGNTLSFFSPSPALADGTWNISATFNIAGALAANDIQGQATGLSLTLDNQIFANSDASNAFAYMDKKFFQIIPGSGPQTPEPASLGLFAGVGLLALRRRKA
jgi:hypothetical protein